MYSPPKLWQEPTFWLSFIYLGTAIVIVTRFALIFIRKCVTHFTNRCQKTPYKAEKVPSYRAATLCYSSIWLPIPPRHRLLLHTIGLYASQQILIFANLLANTTDIDGFRTIPHSSYFASLHAFFAQDSSCSSAFGYLLNAKYLA